MITYISMLLMLLVVCIVFVGVLNAYKSRIEKLERAVLESINIELKTDRFLDEKK